MRELNLSLLLLLETLADNAAETIGVSLGLSWVRVQLVNVQISLWISVLDEVLLTIMIGRLLLTHIHGCESHIALLIELSCL